MKNKHASALGKLSALARKGITDYSQLGKNSWNKLTKKEQKARIDKLKQARKLKKSQGGLST